ncbi:MAG: LysR family transcriptional regulator [Rhodospirillales bacterium]
MNIKGLKAFISVMATGSLVAAAREMNTSVSALSRQLSMLEEQLDLKLFSRDKKRLTPTNRARAFLPEIEKFIGSYDEIPAIVREIKRLPARRLRIGAMYRVANCIVEPAIARYMKTNPAADIVIDILSRRHLERGLLEKTHDLGFGSLPANHDNIFVQTICKIPAVAILHPSHSLANRSSIELAELANEEIILMPPNTLLGQQIFKMLESAGIEAKSRLQVSQTSSCYNLVANGYGVSISDALIPDFTRNSVKIIPLHPNHAFEIGMLYIDGGNKLDETDGLIGVIREEAASFVRSMPLPKL